ncbi:Golgin subfamily A member 5-like protein [Leptotrombidium deliense]|uniref:Golgin subfamily A member 5-like protein n=1 Tax=Leptotrombidium deliense TaxID=299467 RepID=A0A443SMV3_9ACAR|nr:Golgin subfamily A member 5-like protein [Leptotrombidium deliense]
MSWFSEFAKNAEDLLNKVDQNVAVVLKETKPKRSEVTAVNMENTGSAYRQSFVPTSPEYGSGLHSRNSSISSSFSTISTREVTQKTESVKDDDEKLFEFLNAKEAQTSTPQSSTPPKTESVAEESPESDSDPESHSKPAVIEDTPENLTGTVTDVQNNPIGNDNELRDQNETLLSLKKEISVLTKRNVELETEYKRIKKRLDNWKNQVVASDAALRELQSRESDLKAAIDAKNSQLAILRVRLQESDAELKSKQSLIEGLEVENKSLISERQANNNENDENMVSIKNRMKELEEELIQEKELLRDTQTESMKQLGKYEEKQGQLVDEISNLQRNLAREKSNCKDVEKRLKQIENNYSCLESDFNEYKVRAQKTLQSKDELIKALQEGKGCEENNLQTAEPNKFNKVLESQCDAMVIEIQELRERNDYLKKELDRVLNEEVFSLNSQIISLNEQREEEKNNRFELEQDLRQCQEEVRYLHDELNQTKGNLNSRIKDREVEIDKLRKQLVSKRSAANASINVDELESRVKTLTDSLIEKQTLVEQFSSERHSLVLQLQRSEERLREALEAASFNNRSVTIGMVHSSSASNLVNRYRSFVDDDPGDGQVTRGVKRAYGQIDRFSIRLGMFLRAYPSARALVILYIVVLHIWVFFILFTYRPEIH